MGQALRLHLLETPAIGMVLTNVTGHATVTNTYWYLTGVPELMTLAASQFEPLPASAEVDHA